MQKLKILIMSLLLFVLLQMQFVCFGAENWSYLTTEDDYDYYYDEKSTKLEYRYISAYNMYMYYLATKIKKVYTEDPEYIRKYKIKYTIGAINGNIRGMECEMKGKWRYNRTTKEFEKEYYDKGVYPLAKGSPEWIAGEAVLNRFVRPDKPSRPHTQM